MECFQQSVRTKEFQKMVKNVLLITDMMDYNELNKLLKILTKEISAK
tara:strand:- start:398 stop:538 length:141 start_codon:yes stop_codon:yes gene_type:complete